MVTLFGHQRRLLQGPIHNVDMLSLRNRKTARQLNIDDHGLTSQGSYQLIMEQTDVVSATSLHFDEQFARVGIRTLEIWIARTSESGDVAITT